VHGGRWVGLQLLFELGQLKHLLEACGQRGGGDGHLLGNDRELARLSVYRIEYQLAVVAAQLAPLRAEHEVDGEHRLHRRVITCQGIGRLVGTELVAEAEVAHGRVLRIDREQFELAKHRHNGLVWQQVLNGGGTGPVPGLICEGQDRLAACGRMSPGNLRRRVPGKVFGQCDGRHDSAE